MGGTTVSAVGDTIAEVLGVLEKKVLDAYPTLQPDGDAFVFKPDTDESRMYKPIIYTLEDGEPIHVGWQAIHEGHGVGIAVEMTKHYGPKPGPGQWVGGVHLHT